MKRLLLPVFLLTTAHSSGAQLPVPTPAVAAFAHRVAGCYRLDDGTWRADSVRAGDVSTKFTPLAFELAEEVLRGWDPIQSSDRPMFVVRDPLTRRSDASFTYWQLVDSTSETIRIANPLALAGATLTLRIDGRDLAGTITVFTDAIEKDKPYEVTRPVRARRITCPPGDAPRSAPPPASTSPRRAPSRP
jgi:hypothetical protein